MDEGTRYYQAFLNGNEEALGKLIDMYKDGLIFFLDSYVHNLYISEDLVEDTFVKIVVKKPLFFQRSSFKTYLYRMARNQAVDYLRRSSRRQEIPFEQCQNLLVDKMNLEKEYIKEEQKMLVHQALDHLKGDYQQVLYLSYFEDFTNAEIANVLKKNQRQVENLLYNAKKALKIELEKEEMEYEDFFRNVS